METTRQMTREKRTAETRRRAALYTIAPTVIFIISFMMFYKEALLPGKSDMLAHMKSAASFDLVMGLTHNGWHFVCWLFYACLPISLEVAAGLSTAVFNTLTAVLVIWLIERYFKDISSHVPAATVTAIISLIVGPLYLRFYNSRYYMGQGTPNVWHNPTTVACRPFMILITVLTVEYWSCDREEHVAVGRRSLKKTTAYQWGLMLLLLISTIIKPSYLMVYLPVCGLRGLYLLGKGRGKNIISLICQHLYFIPSLLVFLWQYIKIYLLGGISGNVGESGIEIAFFKVARLYASSVTVSLILKMAFPFLVILIWRKVLFKDKLFQLVFAQFVSGLLITWTFAETGKRAKHGNFGWGNMLAASLFWIFCVIFFVKEVLENREKIAESAAEKVKYGIPAIVLLWHLLAGISYYVSLLLNMSSQL